MGVDTAISEFIVDGRTHALTPVMTFLSAWWLKDFVAAAVALVLDLRQRGRPGRRFVVVALATAIAAVFANLAKGLFDRPRPYVQGLWPAIGSPPHTPSMPSGHAATAFAAAVALGFVAPRLRWPALVVAAGVALSRVYLGVHFASDVLVGALLGAAVAVAVARVLPAEPEGRAEVGASGARRGPRGRRSPSSAP